MSIRDLLRRNAAPSGPATQNYAAAKAWADEFVAGLDDNARWALRQALAGPGRFYGANGTIHSSSALDVVVGETGEVRAVWFRCQMLPFRQSRTSASDRSHPDDHPLPALVGVEVVDRDRQ